MQTLAQVFDTKRSSNRLLRTLLAVLALGVAVASDLQHLLFVYPFGVDLEIPLRAAERWRSGGAAYLASAFASPPGATQPFLYPPYVLPPLSLLVDLPRMAVLAAWCLVCVAAFAFIGRRLAFPLWAWPLLLLWPPILEPIIGGNVQLPVVAMFCAVFWTSPSGSARPFEPQERELSEPGATGPGIGVLAALSGSIKVSQPHTWLAVLRRRPRIALIGALAVAIAAALTLPFTGISVWADWLDQLRRATAPTWDLGGFAIARLVNPALGLIVSVISICVLLAFLPRRHTGAWVGVLAVVGATSLHSFGVLFLLPGMLLARRELSLVAAMLIATTTYEGTWAGILVIAGALVLSIKWPQTLEPPLGGQVATDRIPR